MKVVYDGKESSLRILQCLNWQFQGICDVAPLIYEQGFDAVQVGPLQPLKENNYNHWWLSYQPCAFQIGNQYGSKDDFIHLCKVLHENNLLVFVDVICTHVAGTSDGKLVPHEKVDRKLVEDSEIWRELKNIDDWDNRYQVINYCPGLPGFDLRNRKVQDYIIQFLNELIECGANGFRFDSAKNIATPSEGCDFFFRALNCLQDKEHIYNYGEVIFADDSLISLYIPYLDVLTNTWSKYRNHVVTFFESHDSYLGFGYTRNRSSQEVTREYAHVVDNYPKTIYYARPFDNEWQSNEIQKIHKKTR